MEVRMHCRHTKSWLTGEAQMKRSLCTRQSVSLLSCFSVCPYVPGIFWVPAVGCLLQVAKVSLCHVPSSMSLFCEKLISWDQPDQFVLSCVWWKTTCSTIKKKKKMQISTQQFGLNAPCKHQWLKSWTRVSCARPFFAWWLLHSD